MSCNAIKISEALKISHLKEEVSQPAAYNKILSALHLSGKKSPQAVPRRPAVCKASLSMASSLSKSSGEAENISSVIPQQLPRTMSGPPSLESAPLIPTCTGKSLLNGWFQESSWTQVTCTGSTAQRSSSSAKEEHFSSFKFPLNEEIKKKKCAKINQGLILIYTKSLAAEVTLFWQW